MYANINLNYINKLAGTDVFYNIEDTRYIFREYGLGAYITIFNKYALNFECCDKCITLECTKCVRCKEPILMLQVDIDYLDDVIDVVEHETGIQAIYILDYVKLTYTEEISFTE